MDAELLLWAGLFAGGYVAALAWLLARVLRGPPPE